LRDITHLVVVLVRQSHGYLEQLHEAHFHAGAVAERVVAEEEVEARLEVGPLLEDDLVVGGGLDELAHLDEGERDILVDVELEVLVGDRYLVERHAVHLDRFEVLLLLKVDVADVGLQAAR